MSVLPPHQHQHLYGHADTVRKLKDAYDSGKLHHTLIFSGAEGIGKETLAYHLIRYGLAFPDGNPQQNDFTIPNNHRVNAQITAGSHPNLFVIQPVYDDKKQRFKRDITLDALDGLSEFLRLSPMDDAPRFVIINPADSLNMNTQNALLKLLEEPPAKTFFLLLTIQVGQLLPTIRSRCMTVQINAPDEADFITGLGHFLPELSDKALHSHYILSRGSMGRAIQNAEMGVLESYGDVCRALVAWFEDNDSTQAMRLAEQLAPSDQEVMAFAVVDFITDRLATALKNPLMGQGTQAIIPEEQRVLDMWNRFPTATLLQHFDTIKAGWETADHAYLDRKLALLQVLRHASLIDSAKQAVLA